MTVIEDGVIEGGVNAESSRLPVTVISGSLGAGKTSVLKHMLSSCGLRIAVITNDVSETGFDLRHLQHNGLRGPGYRGSEVVGGCICCTRREEFLDQINSVCNSKDVDYLLVESAGVAEPLHIAENFALVKDAAHLDCMVTVVDAAEASHSLDALRILSRLGEAARLNMLRKKTLARPRKLFAPATQLLLEQVRFANVILLNKCDAVADTVLSELVGVVGLLNPNSQIHKCVKGNIEPSAILHTKRFSWKEAESHASWFAEAHSSSVVSRCLPLEKEPTKRANVAKPMPQKSASNGYSSKYMCKPASKSMQFEENPLFASWMLACTDPYCDEC
jgi:G3E family GTPase